MKTTAFKLFLFVTLLVGNSCTKKNDPPVIICNHTSTCNCNHCNTGCTSCKNSASGSVQVCGGDSSLWYISAFPMAETTFLPPSAPKLMLPVNLPPAFKKTGTLVSFTYTFLDSVPFICGRCGTPPPAKAMKIKICKMQEDTLLHAY